MGLTQIDGQNLKRDLDSVTQSGDEVPDGWEHVVAELGALDAEALSGGIDALRSLIGYLIMSEEDAIVALLRCDCGGTLTSRGSTAAGCTRVFQCSGEGGDADCEKIYHIDFDEDGRLNRETFREYELYGDGDTGEEEEEEE